MESYNQFCSLFHGCLIAFEIVDKYVDYVITNKYKEGNLSKNPKDSVDDALYDFFVGGLLTTLIRILLYAWRIYEYRTGDDSEDTNKMHDAINLWMSWVKAVFETFPQATIAEFFFDNCATTDSMKLPVQVFGVFCIIQFIMFVWRLFYYYCKHDERPNLITVISMVIAFIFSVVGFIFACLSMSAFNKPCLHVDTR